MAKVKIPGRLLRAGEFTLDGPPPDPDAPGAQDGDERRVTLAFSSEEAVAREFEGENFLEVLGHADGEADLSRLDSGRAPLLVDHVQNVDSQIGVVERAWIEGGRGRAVVRFGKSARAQEILDRVRDGELSGVSVGYEITALNRDGAGTDGLPILRANWRPYEITLCPVPADPTVGVGRADDPPERDLEIQGDETRGDAAPGDDETRGDAAAIEEENMTDKVAAEARKADDLAAERARVKAIRTLGKRFDMPDEKVDDAIEAGRSEEEFQRDVLDEIGSEEAEETRSRQTKIGLTRKEVQKFSLLRAVQYLANPTNAALRKAAAFEIEVSEAAQSALGRSARGLLVPADILSAGDFVRAVGVGSPNTNAGALVATDHQAGSFIEMLRKRAALTRLGVRTLTGLQGNVDIPRQASGATAHWVGENGAPDTSLVGFNTVALTPHTLAGAVPVTRRALIQSSPDIEALIRDDLIQTLALEIDRVGINGSADTDAPDGLLDAAITAATFADPGEPTWLEVVDLEAKLAADDADVAEMRYVMRPGMRGYLKGTPKVAGAAQFLMEGDEVNGYQAVVSNNGPAAGMILGNWSDLILAMWSGLDLTVDTATLAASGGLVMRAFQDVDFGVRHAKSFVHGQ